jgi:VIT1/CCC1 family predicted Fe2+/Mn2+ transporter
MTALVGAITGTIAMGVGEYLGAQAEARVLQATIDQERLLQQTAPQAEFLEQCQFLEAKGFTPEEAKQFTARLVQNPEHWLAEMVNDEYGIQIEDAQASQAVHGGLILGGAFGVGALLLIGTYMGMHDLPAVLLMAALALGTVGAISGWLSRSNPWLRAAELLFAGFILFDLTAGAGYLFTLF